MSHYHRFIIAASLLFASNAYAVDFFFDALYWRATETIDWSLNNNLSTPNQVITYNTIDCHYEPAFRVGVATTGSTWKGDFNYTRFYTTSSTGAKGNLTSTYLGGKIAQGSNFFNTGQVYSKIDFNMFDLDLKQSIYATRAIIISPIIGLRGGWINQSIITDFQGTVSISEQVKNNFKGIGPKIGIATKWIVDSENKDKKYSIFADFTASYLWGNWKITDVVHGSSATTIYTNVGSRNLGAFTTQGIIGIGLDYKSLAVKFGYEISDWFNQYQVLDDGTGGHNNDLILQGLTLSFTYRF